jgi:hypothetical protein
MNMLRKRIERLEVIDGVGAARVIVAIGPEGLQRWRHPRGTWRHLATERSGGAD